MMIVLLLLAALADGKHDANAAVSKAVAAQMDAVTAGADRSADYRAAQRKLQEALDATAKGGTDAEAYKHMGVIARMRGRTFLDGRKKLEGHDVFSLLQYDK